MPTRHHRNNKISKSVPDTQRDKWCIMERLPRSYSRFTPVCQTMRSEYSPLNFTYCRTKTAK